METQTQKFIYLEGQTVTYNNGNNYGIVGKITDRRHRGNDFNEYLIVEADGCREWRSESQIVKTLTSVNELAITRSASEIEKGNQLVFDNEYCFIHEGKESFIRIDKIIDKINAQDCYFNKHGRLVQFKK